MQNQLFFLFRECLNQVVSVKSTAKLCVGKLTLVGRGDAGYIEITRLNHKDFRMRALLKLVQGGIQITLQRRNDDTTWTNYTSSTGLPMRFQQPRDRIAQGAVDVMMICDIVAQQQAQQAA